MTLPSEATQVAADIREVDTADILTFVSQDVRPENRLIFDPDRRDRFGLPALSTELALSAADRRRFGIASAEHFLVASEIGEINAAGHRICIRSVLRLT